MTDPDRRVDQSTRDRIDELEDRLAGRLNTIETGYIGRADTNQGLIDRLTRRTTILLSVLAVILVGLGALNLVLNSDRIDDIERVVAENNQSRIDITFNNCRSLNDRNRNTVAAFDARLDAARRSGRLSGEQLERARASRELTVGLINALAPRQDCRAQLRDRFGKGARPTPGLPR